MIKKIIVSATVFLIIIMIAVGMNQKSTYTDITAQLDCLDNMRVGVFTEIAIVNNIEKIKKSLPDSNVIVRVTPIEALEIMGFQNRQKVRVEEVYQGSNIEQGDYIYITSEGWSVRLQSYFGGQGDYFENGCVNIMKADEEYLVFLDNIVYNDKKEVVYKLQDMRLSVFSYEEHDNVIIDIPRGGSNSVLYKEVKDNEFFVTTEKALQLVLELKHEMLAKYPR